MPARGTHARALPDRDEGEGCRASRAARLPDPRGILPEPPRPGARRGRARAPTTYEQRAVDPEAGRPAHAQCTRSTTALDRSPRIRALPPGRPRRAPRRIPLAAKA